MNEVAEATISEVAVGAPAHAERKLSFAFAKRHGVLVKQVGEDGCAECVCRQDAGPFAIADVAQNGLDEDHGTPLN